MKKIFTTAAIIAATGFSLTALGGQKKPQPQRPLNPLIAVKPISGCVSLNGLIPITAQGATMDDMHLWAGRLDEDALNQSDPNAKEITNDELDSVKEASNALIFGNVAINGKPGAESPGTIHLRNAITPTSLVQLDVTPTGKDDAVNISRGTIQLSLAQIAQIRSHFIGKADPQVCGAGLYATIDGNQIKKGSVILYLRSNATDTDTPFPVQAYNNDNSQKAQAQMSGLEDRDLGIDPVGSTQAL